MTDVLEAAQAKRLFDIVRQIKGAPLTQSDVDQVNRALAADVAAAHTQGMKASAAGVALIHSFEDFRAATYPDPGPTGKPVTGGWGSTRDEAGKPFLVGVTHDRSYWDRLFARDLSSVEIGVNLLTKGAPTTQAQFDAMVSFAYNVGLDMDGDGKAEGLGDSTLLKKHLAGDYAGAKAQFAFWNTAKGKVLPGLTRRRAAEAALYGAKA
jgi:lysozyme